MTKQEIINQLLAIPEKIYDAEFKALNAHYGVQKQKDVLIAKEDELLLAGAIDGKNAETRQAQLREFTYKERKGVSQAEEDLNFYKTELNRLLNTQSNLRAIVRLLGEGE